MPVEEQPISRRDPSGSQRSAADDEATAQFARTWRARLRPLITDDLIEEHRCNPDGPHSRDLDAVLSYFRRASVAGKLAILAMKPHGPYRIVELSGCRGVAPLWASSTLYPSLRDADHAVFLTRTEALLRRDAQ